MRDELLKAVAARYRSGTRAEKGRILAEFAEISGYHRKHAERLLRRRDVVDRSLPRPERRVYDDAVRNVEAARVRGHRDPTVELPPQNEIREEHLAEATT